MCLVNKYINFVLEKWREKARMNKIIKSILVLVLVLGLLVMVGCGSNTGKEVSLEIASSIEIEVGESKTVDYKVLNAEGAIVSFVTSDEAIVSIEDNKIKGVKEGEATITASVSVDGSEKCKATIKVKVVNNTKFTITLDLNGGSYDKTSIEAKAGDKVVLPLPTKENADFLGWTIEGTSGYITEITNVDRDVTVKANWQEKLVVTFDLDGGSYSGGESATVEDGKSLDLGVPSKAGHTFLGWGLTKDATTYVTRLEKVTENITVYALFKANRIDIVYKLDGGSYNGRRYVTYGGTLNLDVPVKIGYDFLGWSKTQDSTEYITKLENVKYSETIYANWQANSSKKQFIVTNNLYNGIQYLTNVQLSVKFMPKGTTVLPLTYKSSDESILTVSESGLIETYKPGVVTIEVSASGFETQTFEVVVYSPGRFEVSYDTASYVEVNDRIKLNAKYFDKYNNSVSISYKSLDESIAKVDSDGNVTGVKAGTAIVRAYQTYDVNSYFDFSVTVLDNNVSDVVRMILNAHESNVFYRYNLGIGADNPVYYKDIFGSVSDLLFNEELEINREVEAKAAANSANHGGKKSSIEFITVHYTGSMTSGSNARANAIYFATNSETSIHYTTGNDGVYHVLDDSLIGFHAGDGHTDDDFKWTASGIKVKESDPKWPTWGASANGYFMINGQVSTVLIPAHPLGINITGDVFWYNGKPHSVFTKMGIPICVKDGEYYIGTTWWCKQFTDAYILGSKGGNMNSIGIESAVDEGSDLWYTWHKTAKLVAKLMYDNNLDIYRVKGHHFYTSKDCPQPMLENNMEIWWKFIEMVEAEYEMLTKFSDYKFSFEIVSGNETNTERVVATSKPQTITYKVTITKGSETQEVILSSVMNDTFMRACCN